MRQFFNVAAFKYVPKIFINRHLIIPHVEAPSMKKESKKGVEECLRVFGNKVAIFSNTAGSEDDYEHKLAIKIEKALGLSVIRHKEQKPGGIKDVLDFFKCDKQYIVVIGDRYLTDILFGNLHSMLTIHTLPLTKDGENIFVSLIRKIENGLVSRWKTTTQSPPHPLFLSSHVNIVTKDCE